MANTRTKKVEAEAPTEEITKEEPKKKGSS